MGSPFILSLSKDERKGAFHLPLGRRPLIMGILNVTPDSFSDGARYLNPRSAIARALAMQAEGADLIDVGGESTRPGAQPVTAREEIRRVLPVIERLASRLTIPPSIATSKAAVAEAAIQAGVVMVNDVTALRDPRMAQVVARAGLPVILMHMRGTPRTMQRATRYRRLVPEILSELKISIRAARAAGIPAENILIDPGLGFSKGPEQNLVLLRSLQAFKAMGFPVVVGPSRKSFIGRVLQSTVRPELVEGRMDDRIFGTAAVVAVAVFGGADIIRVHEVAAMRQVALVAEAIRNSS